MKMSRNQHIQKLGIFGMSFCKDIPKKQSSDIIKEMQKQTLEYSKNVSEYDT